MKTDANIWTDKAPHDCSWYWRKLNSLKEDMKEWYDQGRYKLTSNGNYSITSSYHAIIGSQNRLANTELIWNAIAQPKHRFVTWLVVQGRLFTKERLQKLHVPVEDYVMTRKMRQFNTYSLTILEPKTSGKVF